MIEFKRYKSDWPFSDRLNQFIRDNNYKYPYLINNDLVTLEGIKIFYEVNSKYGISNQHCANTIFGNIDTNLMFRAWHDAIHIKHDLPFTLEGEIAVYNIMQAELHNSYYLEKLLLYADIVGQTLYFNKYNKFPDNQREFVIDFITKGTI